MTSRYSPHRCAAALALALVAAPAGAEPMNADQARAFVVGRMFSFICFDGTFGSGRIQNDGSVIGQVSMQGSQPLRPVSMPADTVRVRGDNVCALPRGASFEPCFDLHKTSAKSFRGTLAGVPGMWCEFNRSGGGRPGVASRADSDRTVTGSTRRASAQVAD